MLNQYSTLSDKSCLPLDRLRDVRAPFFPLILTLSLLLNLLISLEAQPTGQASRGGGGSCTPEVCPPPDCACPGSPGPPGRMSRDKIPQMIMLTFDDAVQDDLNDVYERLFPISGPRRNPNGCPITATFYVSHNWTNYDLVRRLYDQGHEIASHSVSHRLPQSYWTRASYEVWKQELGGQRENIANKGGIPLEYVRGVRAPFLEIGGDNQFRMMRDEGFEYDATFMSGPHADGGAWPFTLDFVPSVEYCSNTNCPKSRFPGVWELPLNRWLSQSTGDACSMVDSCATQPADRVEALSYFWHNFNRFYRGNRAPLGVHLHPVWLQENSGEFLEALVSFVDSVLDMEDVYFVTAHQVLEWMRDPQSISQVNFFKPWKTSCSSTGSSTKSSSSSSSYSSSSSKPRGSSGKTGSSNKAKHPSSDQFSSTHRGGGKKTSGDRQASRQHQYRDDNNDNNDDDDNYRKDNSNNDGNSDNDNKSYYYSRQGPTGKERHEHSRIADKSNLSRHSASSDQGSVTRRPVYSPESDDGNTVDQTSSERPVYSLDDTSGSARRSGLYPSRHNAKGDKKRTSSSSLSSSLTKNDNDDNDDADDYKKSYVQDDNDDGVPPPPPLSFPPPLSLSPSPRQLSRLRSESDSFIFHDDLDQDLDYGNKNTDHVTNSRTNAAGLRGGGEVGRGSKSSAGGQVGARGGVDGAEDGYTDQSDGERYFDDKDITSSPSSSYHSPSSSSSSSSLSSASKRRVGRERSIPADHVDRLVEPFGGALGTGRGGGEEYEEEGEGFDGGGRRGQQPPWVQQVGRAGDHRYNVLSSEFVDFETGLTDLHSDDEVNSGSGRSGHVMTHDIEGRSRDVEGMTSRDGRVSTGGVRDVSRGRGGGGGGGLKGVGGGVAVSPYKFSISTTSLSRQPNVTSSSKNRTVGSGAGGGGGEVGRHELLGRGEMSTVGGGVESGGVGRRGYRVETIILELFTGTLVSMLLLLWP